MLLFSSVYIQEKTKALKTLRKKTKALKTLRALDIPQILTEHLLMPHSIFSSRGGGVKKVNMHEASLLIN